MACRMWAAARYDTAALSITYLQAEISELRRQGGGDNYWPYDNLDGWSLAGYVAADSAWITRSAIPAAQDSNYATQSAFLLQAVPTNLYLGHVRTATSGAQNVPNPHPFTFRDSSGQVYLLAHNGTLDKETLRDLIGTDWLQQHPPQTFGHGAWDDTGWPYVVDSELLLLWIMQNIESVQGMVLEGMRQALQVLEEIEPWADKNIIFGDSERWYAYRSPGGPDLYYLPAGYSGHYAVMSTPPDTGVAAALPWTEIPDGALVYFNANEGPVVLTDFASPVAAASTSIVSNEDIELTIYPSPTNGPLSIRWAIPDNGPAEFTLYSLLGYKLLIITTNRISEQGQLELDLTNLHRGKLLPAGVYIIQLRTTRRVISRSIVITR